MIEVIVKDAKLQQAAMEGMDAFVKVFVDGIRNAIGGELTAETMAELNSDQITLLAWDMLHEEVMDGGFVQLIHNGLGEFIFKNPFAKALNKMWGMRELSKLIYEAHTLWLKYRDEIEKECNEEEFMALFSMISLLRTRRNGLTISLTTSMTTSKNLQKSFDVLKRNE
jgi:hypothetical protein